MRRRRTIAPMLDSPEGTVCLWLLLVFHSSYSRTTYLGNVLHQLPGAFVLAIPFVALGTSALQNLCWLPLFFLAVSKDANSRTALELALLVLVLSPEVIHEVVTGTGHVS